MVETQTKAKMFPIILRYLMSYVVLLVVAALIRRATGFSESIPGAFLAMLAAGFAAIEFRYRNERAATIAEASKLAVISFAIQLVLLVGLLMTIAYLPVEAWQSKAADYRNVITEFTSWSTLTAHGPGLAGDGVLYIAMIWIGYALPSWLMSRASNHG